MDQRISMITLGVADLDRSSAFYTAMGWRMADESQEGIVFYQMPGMLLGLFPMAELAKDQGRPGASLGVGGATMAHNMPDRAGVDRVYAEALAAGATPLKAPEQAGLLLTDYSYWEDRCKLLRALEALDRFQVEQGRPPSASGGERVACGFS